MKPRYWHQRLQLVLIVLCSLFVTWSEPEALAHRIIVQTGRSGWVCVAALAGVGMVALMDILVNDLMPQSVALPAFFRKRHLVYMALSLGLASIGAVVIAAAGWTVLVLYYWLLSLFAALIAFADLFHRHRSPECL